MTRETPALADALPRERLDKWLWAARFYRTRTLAAQAIDAGHVRVGGERVKPAQGVRQGTRVSVRKQQLTWDVEVLAVSARRGSATAAAALYRESDASLAARARMSEALRVAHGQAPASPTARPTKRDRRRLEDFLSEP